MHRSVVEVRPKKAEDKQRQSVEDERRELEEFVTGKKSAPMLEAQEGRNRRVAWGGSNRPPLARHKSWAYDPR